MSHLNFPYSFQSRSQVYEQSISKQNIEKLQHNMTLYEQHTIFYTIEPHEHNRETTHEKLFLNYI